MNLFSSKFISPLVSCLLAASGLYAGSGKAIVPLVGYARFNATAFAGTSIFITNLTNHNLNVTVKFYGKNGTQLTSLTYDNWINSNTQIAGQTSAYVVLGTSITTSFDYGYATIEWQNVSGNNDTVGRIAHGNYEDYYTSTSAARVSLPINNGLPF